MKKSFFIFILFSLMFTSCQHTSTEKVYHKNADELKYEVPLVNGLRHGIAKKYNKRGKLLEESSWNMGVKEGKHIVYYDNGKIKVKANFMNDMQNGIVEQFDSLGNITTNFTYKNGAIDGDYFEYYSNGFIESRLHYSNDTLNGKGIHYTPYGEKKISVYYQDGREIYRKDYNDKGYVVNSKLPVKITETSDSIFFELEYSDINIDSLAIIIYLGKVGQGGKLLDTTSYKSKRGLEISFGINELSQSYSIQGHICELKYPNRIEGRNPFSYNLETY